MDSALVSIFGSSETEVFYKRRAHKNFTKSTGKQIFKIPLIYNTSGTGRLLLYMVNF